MDIEFDRAKRRSNLAKHGVDLRLAGDILADPRTIVIRDIRRDYGEERFQAFGWFEGHMYMVAYTIRADVCRVISVRRANSRERKRHHSGA